jgi:hypothetical protein
MKTLSFALAALLSLVTLAAAPARAGEPAAAKAPAAAPGAQAGVKEVTLKGTLGCGKCSFHEAKACENVLKVQTGDKVETYALADNEVSKANHEKVCGPASPATVTGTVTESKAKGGKPGKKVLTATSIKFE